MEDYMYNMLPQDENEYDRLKSFLGMFTFKGVRSILTHFDENSNSYNIKLIYSHYMSEPIYRFNIESDENKIKFLIEKYLEIPNDRITIESEIEKKDY